MIYVGIDPGKTGAISFMLNHDHSSVDICYLDWTEADIAAFMRTYVNQSGSMTAVIEQVHAFPGQGAVSMFTFGRNYGFLRGLLVGLRVPFWEVTPQKWQQFFGLGKKKGELKKDYKKRLMQYAQNMFPDIEEDTGRVVNLQNADSLLIMEYAYLYEKRLRGK